MSKYKAGDIRYALEASYLDSDGETVARKPELFARYHDAHKALRVFCRDVVPLGRMGSIRYKLQSVTLWAADGKWHFNNDRDADEYDDLTRLEITHPVDEREWE